MARQLEAAGVRAAAIHGDRSQGQRERALAAFQAGQVDALVATDVAARGIHVDDVAAVLHLDPPADEKDYIHRSGRTGRAGATGVVVSFVAPELRRDVAKMQRTLGLAVGLTEPDVAALPELAESDRRARRSAPRAERTPRADHAPRAPIGRRARPAPVVVVRTWPRRAKPDAAHGPSRPSRPARPARRRLGQGRSPGQSAPGGNRKARRAHLQPGAPAGAGSGPTSRRGRPGADKGKRRQPSGTRSR